jgi:hypothetical protein
MGLSGPIKEIAFSAQPVHPFCKDCVHADTCALEPGVICTDPAAAHHSRELYVWQPACERHAPGDGRDLSLHAYP